MLEPRAQGRTPVQFLALRREFRHVVRLLMLLQQAWWDKWCFCRVSTCDQNDFLSLLLFQCTFFDNEAACILRLLMHLLFFLKLALILVEDGAIEHIVELGGRQRDRLGQCVIRIFTVLCGREISHSFGRFYAVFLICSRCCLLLDKDFY